MASIHALTAHLVPGRGDAGTARTADLAALSTRAAAQETYYIEDGWVFREHHGKYVECICRTEEIPEVPELKQSVFQHR